MFELTDPAGLPSGQIKVTLKWKFTLLPQASSAVTTQQTSSETPERQTLQTETTPSETLMPKDLPVLPQPVTSEVMSMIFD